MKPAQITHLAAYERLRETLTNAQTFRQTFANMPDVDGQAAWVVMEHSAMLTAVNRLRDRAGLAPIDMPAVLEVERKALGHTDYTNKFALYCADLVSG